MDAIDKTVGNILNIEKRGNDHEEKRYFDFVACSHFGCGLDALGTHEVWFPVGVDGGRHSYGPCVDFVYRGRVVGGAYA